MEHVGVECCDGRREVYALQGAASVESVVLDDLHSILEDDSGQGLGEPCHVLGDVGDGTGDREGHEVACGERVGSDGGETCGKCDGCQGATLEGVGSDGGDSVLDDDTAQGVVGLEHLGRYGGE